MWKKLRVLLLLFLLGLSSSCLASGADYKEWSTMQLLKKLETNLQQEKQNNETISLELSESKKELIIVKQNSEATILSLKKTNEYLKSYAEEQRRKKAELRAQRDILIVLLLGAVMASIGH